MDRELRHDRWTVMLVSGLGSLLLGGILLTQGGNDAGLVLTPVGGILLGVSTGSLLRKN